MTGHTSRLINSCSTLHLVLETTTHTHNYPLSSNSNDYFAS